MTVPHAVSGAETADEMQFFGAVRKLLAGEPSAFPLPKQFARSFDPSCSQLYITLFQRGVKPMRWGSRRRSLEESVRRAVAGVRKRKGFEAFHVSDPSVCRIMVEMVTEEIPCRLEELTWMDVSPARYEPGVTGVRCVYEGTVRYVMPTDAVTHSIMSVTQLLDYLAGRSGLAQKGQDEEQRAAMMRGLPLQCSLLKSVAVITYEAKTLPLYRGLPSPFPLSAGTVERVLRESIGWLADNMRRDGRFLYYYDPLRDSEADFQHPKNPGYYNILRHSGATITLLEGYTLFKERRLLEAARRSIDYFVTTLQEEEDAEGYRCYPFYNKKSKLGGAGIGLAALMRYRHLSGDGRYGRYAEGLVRHLLSRIDSEGEMIGYYRHPRFGKGAPLVGIDDKTKRGLFSFYYPGEALLGLALFHAHGDGSDKLKARIRHESRRALDFLIHIRPKRYADLFEPLPADSWLMQAIEAWDTIGDVVTDAHRAFVYGDAAQMIRHMYTPDDALCPDYAGGFYYRFGDHVYHDGSRCEGLMAAYRLARQRGERAQMTHILGPMLLAARGLLATFNTPESAYAHRYPERSVGSFRFKLTRQWIRVDAVQHAACFYARLLPIVK
ncbi:protein containing Six-hairpin glycosidase-like domain protein [Sulfurimonas sp. HSL1-6]|uniref:protein containing Six-hairpin glycosidase-like domain protein n=1 Tax=Thiomicrolovo immobilis TaxID=3131935 RepID=UPI0031F7C4FD